MSSRTVCCRIYYPWIQPALGTCTLRKLSITFACPGTGAADFKQQLEAALSAVTGHMPPAHADVVRHVQSSAEGRPPTQIGQEDVEVKTLSDINVSHLPALELLHQKHTFTEGG